MRRAVLCALGMLSVGLLAQAAVVRVSGDNEWQVFVNGELLAQGNDWQRPTVTEFELKNGSAVIAVYVHDFEPGAAGVGGFLADIILDNGEYLPTEPGSAWVCDAGEPIANRNDGWEQPNFDDSGWGELQYYEQFGGGVWGFGAATMRQVLHDPDCTAFWAWCGPNNEADDVYFRYTIGKPLAVEPTGKLATAWGALKSRR
ncbi:MAG: hypothetical protein KatS3mg115_0433 [Candidatus Poribacteria bacterium]|nr:MAG: hypothetical protein KatS3mg115_0433 [Candidatus Poribacteria bacterium]